MIVLEFPCTAIETAETKAEESKAENGQDDDDVVGRQDFGLHHLYSGKEAN